MAISAPGLFNRGYAYLALAASLWALNLPASRLFMEHGLEPRELAFWRCLTGTALFGLHVFITGRWRAQPKHILQFIAFGVIGVGFYNLSSQIAAAEAGAALGVILLYTAPAWVALLSRVLLKHPLSPRAILALLLSTGGVMLLAVSGAGLPGGPSAWGVLNGLFSGLCYAMHFIYNAHWNKLYHHSTLYFYAMLGGLLCIVPFSATEISIPPPTTVLLLFIVFSATTYFAYLAYGAGMLKVKPVPAAVIVNLEPIIGTLLAFVLLGETFPLGGLFGAVMVITAVLLLATGKKIIQLAKKC